MRELWDFIAPGDVNPKQQNLRELTFANLLPSSDSNILSLYHLLKKPDFQRETNEWDKNRIADLIKCIIDGSFIPAVILWRNNETGKIFVIDGAHRLSALLAFINDDYGDREISHNFYGYNKIPQAEINLAQDTREYIEKVIGGSFKKIMQEGGKKADSLKQAQFTVQVIEGDVKLAEDSHTLASLAKRNL